ncbi:MAG: family nitrogen regulator [Planctomycetaceae bacterium]|nr:family nitrogen regulator [Planctomycetaceae bacterium]
MKLIVALIRPENRAAVLDSTKDLDVSLVSISQSSDGGTQVISGTYRGADARTHSPKLRLEVAVCDDLVDEVVDAIIFAAGTDASTLRTCHVFVMPLEEWVQFPDVESVPQRTNRDDSTREEHVLTSSPWRLWP